MVKTTSQNNLLLYYHAVNGEVYQFYKQQIYPGSSNRYFYWDIKDGGSRSISSDGYKEYLRGPQWFV